MIGIGWCGGRTTIHDLQTILSVDIGDIENSVRALVADKASTGLGTIRLVGAELVSETYLNCLVSTDMLQYIDEEGITTIGSIAKQFSLPMDLVGNLVRDGIDAGMLNSTVKVHASLLQTSCFKFSNVLTQRSSIITKKQEDEIEHRLKGMCCGFTRVTGLDKVAKILGILKS